LGKKRVFWLKLKGKGRTVAVMKKISKLFREPVNALSHMAGSLASIAGLTLMVVMAAIHADVWHVVSFAVFGTTLVFMYTTSFL
jgi:hemolysin III